MYMCMYFFFFKQMFENNKFENQNFKYRKI